MLKSNLIITAPVKGDYTYFHESLCPADRAELKEVAGITAPIIGESIMGYAAESFICFTVVEAKTGTPVAIFGCISQQTEEGQIVGAPWLLTNGELWKYPKETFRLAKAWVRQMREYFSSLHVIASTSHPKSIPFLKALGFTLYTRIRNDRMNAEVLIHNV